MGEARRGKDPRTLQVTVTHGTGYKTGTFSPTLQSRVLDKADARRQEMI
jgi:hypothetical protein